MPRAREQERAGSGTRMALDDKVPAGRTRCEVLARAGQQRGRLSALPQGDKRGHYSERQRDEWGIESITLGSGLVFMPIAELPVCWRVSSQPWAAGAEW